MTSKRDEDAQKIAQMIRLNGRLSIRNFRRITNLIRVHASISTYDLDIRRMSAKRRVNAKIFLATILCRDEKIFQPCSCLPYTPDIATFDFLFFLKINALVKERRFDSIPDIESATTAHLNTEKKEDFHKCFQSLNQL